MNLKYNDLFYRASGYRVTAEPVRVDPLEGAPDHWPNSNPVAKVHVVLFAPDKLIEESIRLTFYGAEAAKAFALELPRALDERAYQFVSKPEGLGHLPDYFTTTADVRAAQIVFTVCSADRDGTTVVSAAVDVDMIDRIVMAVNNAAKCIE